VPSTGHRQKKTGTNKRGVGVPRLGGVGEEKIKTHASRSSETKHEKGRSSGISEKTSLKGPREGGKGLFDGEKRGYTSGGGWGARAQPEKKEGTSKRKKDRKENHGRTVCLDPTILSLKWWRWRKGGG